MQDTLERLRTRREELGDEGGFTLIELLIVIVVLGILAAIVVFAVQNLTGNSAQSACASDLADRRPRRPGLHRPGAQHAHRLGHVFAPRYHEASPTGQQNQTVGPWLHNTVSSSHYTITVTGNGNNTATITVARETGGAVLSNLRSRRPRAPPRPALRLASAKRSIARCFWAGPLSGPAQLRFDPSPGEPPMTPSPPAARPQ